LRVDPDSFFVLKLSPHACVINVGCDNLMMAICSSGQACLGCSSGWGCLGGGLCMDINPPCDDKEKTDDSGNFDFNCSQVFSDFHIEPGKD
jgi:hypothetical protein